MQTWKANPMNANEKTGALAPSPCADAQTVNHNAVVDALRRVLDEANARSETHGGGWFELRQAAAATLRDVDAAYSFNEFVSEHGNPDYALEDMDYLDELAEMGGDWSKPSFILARAFYGYRFNPYRSDSDERGAFNPNDEYFTFNGYGNLVSVAAHDWAAYWAASLDADYYTNSAEDAGQLEAVAEALGVELSEDGDESEEG